MPSLPVASASICPGSSLKWCASSACCAIFSPASLRDLATYSASTADWLPMPAAYSRTSLPSTRTVLSSIMVLTSLDSACSAARLAAAVRLVSILARLMSRATCST